MRKPYIFLIIFISLFFINTKYLTNYLYCKTNVNTSSNLKNIETSKSNDLNQTKKVITIGKKNFIFESISLLIFILFLFYLIRKQTKKIDYLKSENKNKTKIQKAILNENSKFKSLLFATDNIYFEIDRDLKIVNLIVKEESNLYKSKKEVIGKTFIEIFGEEKGTQFEKIIKEVFATGKSRKIEYELTIGGQERFYEAVIIKYQVDMVLAIIRDISREKSDRDIFNLFSDIISKSLSIIVITDYDGNIVYVNPKFFEVTGYSLDEVIGKNPRILKSGKHKTEFYRKLWDTIKSKKVWHDVFINKKKNGELFWEDAYITPVENEKGEITHFFKVAEDITELKKAKKELAEEKILFETYFNAANVIIVGLDKNYTVKMINPKGIETLRYSKEEILGKNWIDNFIPKDKKKIVKDYLDSIFLGKKEKARNKNKILCKNNELKTILWQNVLLKRGDENLIIGSGIDITNQEIADRIRNILRKIMYYVFTVENLDEFYKKIRFQLNRIIDAKNMFIILKEKDNLTLVFNIDEKDNMTILPKKKTLSEYVLSINKTLYLNKKDILKLIKEGKAELVGALPEVWVGIPLKIKNETIGILGLQSYSNEKFISKKDLSYFEMISFVIAMAIKYKRDEIIIANNLKEKNMLLREVHHRVKNNIQYIFSMFKMQGRYIGSEKIKEFIVNNVNRIKVMSILQSMLYQDDKIVKIDIFLYFYKLVQNLLKYSGKRVHLNFDIKDIYFDYNLSMPLGFIVNELVANSLKHAYTKDIDAELFIGLKNSGDEEYVLEVSDNGVGLDKSIDLEEPTSFGLMFVKIQVDQINGKLGYKYENGAKFQIRFRKIKLSTFGEY